MPPFVECVQDAVVPLIYFLPYQCYTHIGRHFPYDNGDDVHRSRQKSMELIKKTTGFTQLGLMNHRWQTNYGILDKHWEAVRYSSINSTGMSSSILPDKRDTWQWDSFIWLNLHTFCEPIRLANQRQVFFRPNKLRKDKMNNQNKIW